MAQRSRKTETPNLSTSENVNMLSSTIQPASETGESFQETGDACKIQCDQNPDMSANRENENETLNSQQKKKKRKSAADTCKETTQPKQFLLEGEHTDTETRQFGDVDKETNCCSADTGDGANYYPKTTSDATDLQGTVDDGHPPKLTQEDQVPKSYSRVKDEANQGLALSEDGIVEQSAKATVANSVLHQYNKSADSTGDGILTPEKQRSGNESAKEGEANGETANNEENTHNQQDLKKKEGIPQTKKKKRKSAADTCKETTQPKQFLLKGEQTDTETRQFGDVDKETNCCSADTGDGANYYPKTTSDATDLQGTVDDGHPPKLTQEDQVPKSYSRVKDEANQGLALSEDGIVEQSAKATVANSVLHQYNNKSADSTGDGILTPEKQRSGNESAKEGEANGETANNEENTHNQQDLKKKEGIPQTKGQYSGTDNIKNLIQQHDSKTVEKKCTDNTSERPKQKSTEELTTSENSNTSTNEDKKTLSRKEKKQQKKHSKEVPSGFSYSKPEETILIYFYAILSDHFKLNPSKDKVFIRSGTLADDWKTDILEMNVVKKLEHHGYFIEGCHYVHKNKIGKKHPYKYVVIQGNKEVYEFIYKLDSPSDCIANRCLDIKQNLLVEGEWHQYDDIICAPPEKALTTRFWDAFKNKKNATRKGKQLAGKIMMESIFDTLTTWDERNLKNFLMRLQHFFAVYEIPMVFEQMPVKWVSLSFGKKEVQDILKSTLSKMVMHPNQDSVTKANSVQSCLRTGILTLYLTDNYSLEWSDSELAAVCDIFSVQQFPANIVANEVNTLKKTFCFGNGILETLKQIIVRCIEHQILNWVHVIPVFHLFGFTSNVTRPDILASSQSEDSWDGLDGLPIITFRQKIDESKQRKLLELMGKTMHLMAVDKLLARSWFSLLPMTALPEYMEIITPDLFDVLHGIIQRLKYGCISDMKLLDHILKLAERSLNNQKRDMCGERLEACMKAIAEIHEMICKSLKKTNFIEVIASSVVLMSKFAALIKSSSKFADDKSQNEEGSEMASIYLRMILTTTRQWLKVVLDSKLLINKVVSLNQDEFQVWVTLITLDLGNKKWTSSWRKELVSDLEGRMKKEKPDHQVVIYCKIFEDTRHFHPLIAECFEKCALEAAHSMCQDKSEAQLLNKLSNYDLTKFGKLLSTIIENSWEKDYNGMFLEDYDSVLQHLLNWTALKTIFRLHGMNSQVTEGLSNKATNLIALAVEVFHDVMSKLWEGSIKIKHLECILKKKSKFSALYMTKLNISFTDKNLNQLLIWRQIELNKFYEEIKCMESFLKMCRKIEEYVKVAIEELEKLVAADVCSMELSKVVTVKQITTDYLESNFPKITYFSLSEEIKEKARNIHTFEDSYILQMCWKKKVIHFCVEDGTVEDETPLPLEKVCSMIWDPCFDQYTGIFAKVKEASITFAEVDDIFKDYRDRYDDLRSDLKIMCRIDRNMKDDWIEERIRQIMEYHQLHLAVESAQVIKKIQSVLNLTGNFTVLETLLNMTDESYRHCHLECIDEQLIQAKNHLHKTKPCMEALKELTQSQQFVQWIKEALKDVNELKVFVDLASISAGENDLDVDRVACFHDAVLGYSSLLFEIQPTAGFVNFIHYLQKLQKALKNDPHLIKKLRDSARHLEWLKTVKESHGSIEQSSLALASSINNSGIYNISSHGKNKLSLGSVIILNLPETYDGKVEVRSYTLEDLKELQNKLMLMSGKGDHCREEVDRFVEVFANVQRLATSFISLFSAGNMLFRNLKVEVHCSKKCEACIIIDFNLKEVSNIKASGDVTEQLPILCKKMEAYLEVWKQYMDQHRSRYYYLNFYTAEQLVYLSTQLFDRNCNRQDVLMMLSFIKPNCTAKDIKVAQQKLFYGDARKRNKPLTDSVQPFTMRQVNIQDLAMEVKIDLVWKHYMENMTYFLSSCLDVSTLGKLLENVADSKQTVTRVLVPGFQKSQPNLVVCPHSDVLSSALSIYLHSSNQPLPTYDEVLLCTAETTYEQVDLFLRRCLTAGCMDSKIYSLLYADELTYDVSVRFEELFKILELTSQSDYKLVIFCSYEREHCYVPTAFSRHKVHMMPQVPLEKIQSYLENHYKISTDSSAATVFSDGMFIRIISSKRAGVGKSLYVKRLHEKLKQQTREENLLKTVHLLDTQVDENKVLQALFTFIKSSNGNEPLIFHFDITSSVQKGLCEFLFKLFILQYLMGTDEKMWKCSQRHLYVVEMLEGSGFLCKKQTRQGVQEPKHNFLDVFPKVFCRSPKEVLEQEVKKSETLSWGGIDPLMDKGEFRSEAFQRPYQYLREFKDNKNLDTFVYQGTVEGNHVECLQLFLIYCGVMDPSWSELRNFAWFLNLQLKDCETSVFCKYDLIQDILQGFKNFVVNFMILMARDFATPSLSISDQSSGIPATNLDGVTEDDIAPFLLRKKWESEPHPYIFFNADHASMTFIGFHLQVNKQGGVDAINPSNGKVIKSNIMTRQLYQGLLLQKVPFNIEFDKLPRSEKIEWVCTALGIEWPHDPDVTFELTTDNVLKILAIHMRFRCGIPVIIMGETGCGKTRLIKFLCELQKTGADTENMKLVKVHGGTTSDGIYAKIKEAEVLAEYNKQNFNLDTILFFDEANTTEAVSCIKEVVCDQMIEGIPLTPNTGLQIIAACNPYRKHTDEMIKRLESAGLGYRVRADETEDKLGSIPLRQLVYRVQALPPSMIPLVWDFGQLDDLTEKMYIQQIVQRLTQPISDSSLNVKCMVDTLSASQNFMRCQRDECSFVSLRDVERCMKVFIWFYSHRHMLLNNLKIIQQHDANEAISITLSDNVIWPFVLALGVCYHACLEKKTDYRNTICLCLPPPYNDPSIFLQKLELFQDLLLSGVPLRETIARNSALKENVFMMVICIELKIPLFLVGKPGSSKSLAKTIVADAMQGQAAHSELYKKLKQIHLVSFQCSPHSTSEGIINTFKQCARFQEGKNLDEYVSVVVLDEIGLAEDSPKMPLKTLHPLLEDGCIDDDHLKHKRVGFIGISNWALDPAKMNRGVFVSRGDPDRKELIESAKGISSSDPMIQNKMIGLFVNFAEAYLRICEQQSKEFFGLRDYYSLIKMVFSLSKVSKSEPTPKQLAEVVLRNFSGSDDVKVMDVFKSVLKNISHDSIKTLDLIRHNIYADSHEMECRYLLILTKNFAALQILQQMFFSNQHQPEIIFGSSFPKDQDYTQICRNINRVKTCMETGQMVVLLNLQNLYESLYDALNQYYVYLGGQKYVDLGLGTHRVKCRVHSNFRLMVIEEKEIVYREFPIPLINRLEKHYLDINTVLNKDQRRIVTCLEKWVQSFTAVRSSGQQRYDPPDVFVGYHSDTCSSVVLQITQRLKQTQRSWEVILKEAQWVLLNCATPDSVIRLAHSQLPAHEADVLMQQYFEEQHHDSLADFIQSHIKSGVPCWAVFTEVTTYSRLLTASDVEFLQKELGDSVQNIFLYSLQQFDTEHSFLKKIRHCIDYSPRNTILLIQTDFENSSQSANLIASAKYSTLNEISKNKRDNRTVYVYFLTKLSRIEGGSAYIGFQGDPWQSVHIDDLRKSKDMFADMTAFKDIPMSQLFGRDLEDPEPMIVNQKEAIFDETKILDTTILIRNCVQSAVGMLRDQHQNSNRSTARVEILLSLLSEDVEFKASFLALMKKRLHSLLLKRDAKSNNPSEWLIREASNVEALQEGGTFRHTLWKRIQTVVTPLLAQIISVIDRDCNLNLLSDDTPIFVRNLWIKIFKDANLLDLPYYRATLSVQSEIVVYNYMKMEILNISSRLPFSWKIKDFLDELWVQAQYMEGQNQHKLNEIFNKTGFGKYLSNIEEEWRQDLFFRYLHDFLLMSISISSESEFEFLQRALISCINQLKIESNIGDDVSLLWVHFAYQHFKNRLQNFSRIVVIHPSVLTLLQKKKDEIQEAENKEMVIDIYAAAACVEMLEFEHSELSYTTWLQMVNTLQMPIELVSAEVFSHCEGSKSSIANYVKCEWCRILSLSLFVEHIILGVEEIHVELPNKVVSYAGRLAKSLNSNSDVRSQGPFRAVVEVLRDCKNSAGLLFFRYGLKECRICLGELNNPVLLPCDHLYCLDCINKCLQTGQRKCPMLCSNDLDNGYIPVVSEEIREAVAKIGVFRKRCDAFFIALVSMVCFKDNSPPTKGVVDDLLSLMIVEKRGLPSISKKDHLFFTSNLSPFDDAVDRNPVVRSIVLKLLLKYSFDDIKDHMQDYLSEVQKTNIFGKENETELYALFLNCLEDSIYEKSQLCTEQEKIAYLAREGEFLLMYIHHKSKQTTIETLQIIARIRLCLDTASQLLCEKCDMLAQDLKHLYIQAKETFLHRVKHLIQNGKNEWFKIYLLRKMCSLNGIEFVQELSMDDRFSWLFPHEIILKRHNSGQLDRYLACGTNYQKFRDAVTKALVTGEFKSITEVQKGCKYSSNEQGVHVTLAIFREITMLYSSNQLTVHPNKDKCDMIEKYIENENLFHSTMCKNFAVGLLKNDIPGLEINPEQKSQEKMITEIIIHVAAILLCGERNGILAPLQNLSFQPADMVKAFLPTMPEDMITEARRWDDFKNVRWYQCPNGHPCAIGECGRPTVKSYCIECKAEIGGLHHIPVHGFTETPMKDKTQTGHILGDPNKRETTVALDKQMPLVSFLLMRLMTHVALFLGTIEDEKSIKLIIHPCVENPRAFLRHHIEKDIEQLKKSLEKTIDETAIVVHLILSQLIKQGQCPRREVGKFSTKDNRNSWEDFISKVVITPTVKDLDMMLGNVNRQISQDERICSDILVKTVYNDPQTFLRLPKESALHCSSIWSCRKRISIEHLRHIVEQKDVKDDVPILQTFLQKEPQLRLVKYLPELLALQYDLMKLFQNALEVPKQSIHDFLQTFSSELVKSTFTSQISAFIYVWNQLRTFLFSNGEIKIPEEYCALDLDMQNCQLEVLLPRRQGLGLCSTALVSYLIALQNYMVYAVEKYTPEYTLYSVSPQDVSELHVIRYEIGKDMIPLLSSNCQYTVEKGSEMVIEYDFNRIEQQLTNRFLKGKPLISLKGVPTLIYRQDRNYEIIFEDIKNKIVQESLPVSVINAISVELQSYNEVCEAFTAVEVTIGFLAMSGGDPDLELVVYLKEVLQMEAQTVPHVMDTLRRCKLKHIQALWQLLSSRKSECSLHLNRDPFSGIKAQYKTVLNGEAKKQLRAFFIQASVDIFILELHEMLILKCKNIQSSDYFDPSWSLKVCLEDFKEQDNLPELEDHFPETVSMSESVETWKAAVAFKREQSQFTR